MAELGINMKRPFDPFPSPEKPKKMENGGKTCSTFITTIINSTFTDLYNIFGSVLSGPLDLGKVSVLYVVEHYAPLSTFRAVSMKIDKC